MAVIPGGGGYIWHIMETTDKIHGCIRKRSNTAEDGETRERDREREGERKLSLPQKLNPNTINTQGEKCDATSPLNSAAFCFICSILMGVESLLCVSVCVCVCVCVCARCEMEGEQTSAETDIKCFTVWCSEPAHPPVHPPLPPETEYTAKTELLRHLIIFLASSPPDQSLIMLVIRIDGDTDRG